jgi:hypothetical protein
MEAAIYALRLREQRPEASRTRLRRAGAAAPGDFSVEDEHLATSQPRVQGRSRWPGRLEARGAQRLFDVVLVDDLSRLAGTLAPALRPRGTALPWRRVISVATVSTARTRRTRSASRSAASSTAPAHGPQEEDPPGPDEWQQQELLRGRGNVRLSVDADQDDSHGQKGAPTRVTGWSIQQKLPWSSGSSRRSRLGGQNRPSFGS